MPKTITLQLPFENELFKCVWQDWISYRIQEKKLKGYTKTGLTRVFNQLVRLSNNNEAIAIKIIEQSIDKGWKDLYAIKELQTIEQRKKSFFQKLQTFKENNSGLYPKALYQEFFNYWTKEDSITNQLAFEKVLVFNFEEKLKSWCEKTDKEKLSQMWKEQQPVKQLNLSIFKSEV